MSPRKVSSTKDVRRTLISRLAPDSATAASTFHLENRRALAMGIVESANTTFLFLILVRWFEGGTFEKAIVAGAAQGGLLLAPLTIFLVRSFGWSVPKSAGRALLIAAVAMGVAAVAPSLPLYTIAVVMAGALPAACTPLFTTIYQANYPALSRGRLFSWTNAIRILASIVFAALAGWALSGRIPYYPILLSVFALALTVAATLAMRIPDTNIEVTPTPLLSCFGYLRTDPVLRETLVSWMLLGFGTLMMAPLRVEYLANPTHGLNLSEVEVALLITTVPNLARLAGSTVWGRLFDKINFFALRACINVCFMLAILSFFSSSSWLGLGFSAVVFGFSTSGGDVAWHLWATKFAPPDRVPDYMAVHTFFTGVRGLLAPAAAFMLLGHASLTTISWIAIALMTASVILLIPRATRRRGQVP